MNSQRILFWCTMVVCLYGCAMSEEMRRIQNSNRAQALQDESRSGDLTGEQIFIRSCNTCHPSGRKGFGPSLANLAADFPDDQKLKAFIRKGKGMMPGQPKQTINDHELDNLVVYLRSLSDL